jgi:4'-phosphopantetheinyl transferase
VSPDETLPLPFQTLRFPMPSGGFVRVPRCDALRGSRNIRGRRTDGVVRCMETVSVPDDATPARAAATAHGAFALNLRRDEKPVAACFGFVRESAFAQVEKCAAGILSPAEAAGLERCRTPIRRLSYLAGRFAARQAVALYLRDQPDCRFDISSGVFNQPVVRCESSNVPGVTISHTRDVAVAIAHDAGHLIGVDVETIGAARALDMRAWLTGTEQRLVAVIPWDRATALTALWTAKEALSKALKCGLTVPMSVLEISALVAESSATIQTEFTNFCQYKCLTWTLERHVLSIALPRKSDVSLDGFAS